MRELEVDGITFELFSWEFRVDGTFGHIKFLVLKGIYDYGGKNGAYCWKHEDDKRYDIVGASCSCFQVNGHYEAEFMGHTLREIAYAAVEFINSLPKTESYQAKLDYQKYGEKKDKRLRFR